MACIITCCKQQYTMCLIAPDTKICLKGTEPKEGITWPVWPAQIFMLTANKVNLLPTIHKICLLCKKRNGCLKTMTAWTLTALLRLLLKLKNEASRVM